MASRLLSLLTVCGLEEIEQHGSRAVSHVLSILDPDWPDPSFALYPPHSRTVLRFHDAIEPAPGTVLPTAADVDAILAFGRSIETNAGGAEAHLLVHCHAGISRSTAAMTAILAQARPDAPEDAVLDQVAAIRPQAWPNLRMIELTDAALGRSGRLVQAVAALYGRRLAAKPDLAEVMARLNRAREVEIGLAGQPLAGGG